MQSKDQLEDIAFQLLLVCFCVAVISPVKALEVSEGATSASFDVLDPGIYEVINQTVPGAFMIDILGSLYLTGHVTIDYEEAPVHHVVYRKLTTGVSTATEVITVYVREPNGNAPVFDLDLYYGAVTSENIGGGTLLTVDSTDADGKAPNNEIDFYAIVSGNTNDTFKITKNGHMSVTSGKETTVTQRPLYSLTVIAVDKGIPPQTGTATVVIQACGN